MMMNQQIIEIFDTLCKKFGVVIDWTSNNVLPQLQILVKKFATYKIITDSSHVLISIVLIVGGIVAIKKIFISYKEISKQNIQDNLFFERIRFGNSCGIDMRIIGYIFSILGGFAIVFGVIILKFSIDALVRDIVFPEMVILEYVKCLVGD